MKHGPAVLLLFSLGLAGCSLFPAAQPAPAPTQPKLPPSRFDCSFTGDKGPQFRTYLMSKGTLTEKEAPHRHFRITSDNGDAIAAKHEERGGATALLTIDLRQHQAVLTEISPASGETKTLPGTCAENG
jgi:hypothetical protein